MVASQIWQGFRKCSFFVVFEEKMHKWQKLDFAPLKYDKKTKNVNFSAYTLHNTLGEVLKMWSEIFWNLYFLVKYGKQKLAKLAKIHILVIFAKIRRKFSYKMDKVEASRRLGKLIFGQKEANLEIACGDFWNFDFSTQMAQTSIF